MEVKENSLKQNFFNQISKNGLLENDKKLLIKKFGLNNLSHPYFYEDKNSSNQNYSLIGNSLSTIKFETKKHIKSSPKIKNNNQSLNNLFKRYTTSNEISKKSSVIKYSKKSSDSLSKNSLKKNLIKSNNKSMAVLPISSKININKVTDYCSNKKKIKYEGRNNCNISSYGTTTAQNSIKTNQNINSNNELLGISPQIRPVKRNKTKPKIHSNTNNTVSNTDLIFNIQKTIIENKEKPYKIFNNNPLNNYNTKNNIKDNKVNYFDSTNKKSYSNKKIKSKIINRTNQNRNIKTKNIISSFENISKDKKKNENEEKNLCNFTGISNENSEDTKKESCIDLQKIFNDKILNNNYKKNILNEINSNNINLNSNSNKQKDKKNIIKNNKEDINEQVKTSTFNNKKNEKIDDKDENSYKNINTQKISLTNVDTKMKNEINNIIKNDSNNNNNDDNNKNSLNKLNNCNYEEDKKEEKTNNNQNDINDIENENFHNNNTSEYQEKNDENNIDNSSIKTHKNIYKKLYDLNQEMNKQEEKEIQGENDNKSGQTQTTVDKNNIISKFIKQPIYNISPRFLINEVSLNANHTLPNKSFMFINDIEQENKRFPIMNIKKILKLKDKSIYNLISYTYDNFPSIISISKFIKNKINISLKHIFQHVIDDFKSKYKNFLNVIDYSFNQKEFIYNHKKSHLFNLEIRCQIVTKETKKSYEIGCNYISYNKKYDYIWKFDVQNKDDIKLWLCTELDVVNNSYKKFSYTSQVASFSFKDEILLQFNIFSKGNNIEPNSIEWTEPIESYAATEVYENSKFISSISFDQIRACEVETQILFWKNKLPKDDRGIINDFKKIFEKFFEIKKIFFDESKFYFFKIEMKANKIGLLKQNKFSTFDINIIDYKSNIKNEIQCIYLMNSNYYTKIMDIRIGTNVTLYIVDMKR